MILNAVKYAVGVSSCNFLGHLVTQPGNEVNLEQIVAINDLENPKNVKGVQKLIRMAMTLNQFINKSFNKCRLFFELLCKNTKSLWNEECELAL